MAEDFKATLAVDDADFLRGMQSASAAAVAAGGAVSNAWDPAAGAIAVAAAAAFAMSEGANEAAIANARAGIDLANFNQAALENAQTMQTWAFATASGKRALLELADDLAGPVVRGFVRARGALADWYIDLVQGAGAADMIREANLAAYMQDIADATAPMARQFQEAVEAMRGLTAEQADARAVSDEYERLMAIIREIAELEGTTPRVLRMTQAAKDARAEFEALLETRRNLDARRRDAEADSISRDAERARALAARAADPTLGADALDELDRIEREAALQRRLLEVEYDRTLNQAERLRLQRELIELAAAEDELARARRDAEREALQERNAITFESIEADLLDAQGEEKAADLLRLELETRRRIREIEQAEGFSDQERQTAIDNLREIQRLRAEEINADRVNPTTRVLSPGGTGFSAAIADRILGGQTEASKQTTLLDQIREGNRQLVETLRRIDERGASPTLLPPPGAIFG